MRPVLPNADAPRDPGRKAAGEPHYAQRPAPAAADADAVDEQQGIDPDAVDDGPPVLSVADNQLGKSRLLSRQCATCILRPGDPMQLGPDRLRQFLAQARAGHGFVICHSTLPHYRYPDAKPAICRGFADRYRTTTLQLMQRLWGFVEVDPPGLRPREWCTTRPLWA